MGCGASTQSPLRYAPDDEPTKAPETIGEAQEKLQFLLGGVRINGEAACAKALTIISSFFAAKFSGRAPTKPIDLLNLIDKESNVEPQLIANLKSGLASKTAAAVSAALSTVHTRALPKMGLGVFTLHERCPGEEPIKVAFENGARLFPMMDPMPGPFAKINPVEKFGNELREFDLSTDACIMSCVKCFVPANTKPEEAKGCVRRSFDAFKDALGPLKVGEGQPLLDGYTMVFPTPLVGMPSKEPLVDVLTFGEMWAEMEALVDEGLVRTIGISNFTMHQIDALLKVAKYRPAFLQQERHILNPVSEFKAFCDARKIAMIAPVPLATGEVLDSAHLVHAQLTPAQAALHWNICSGVSVIPGAETTAQIIENCATMQKLHLPPITPPEPLNPLRKIYPVWPSMRDLFCESATANDAGIFVTDDRGFLVCAKDESKVGSALMAAPLTAAEEALLREVSAAVACIPMNAAPLVKRSKIDEALAGMAANLVGQEAPPSERANDKVAGAHTFAPRAEGNLTRMVVVPFPAFLAAGKIPRRSVKDEAHCHVSVDDVGPDGKVLFFSQRWLTPCGDPASPDDADGTKYKSVVSAAKAWAALNGGVPDEQIFVWIDYACVDQDDVPELTRGVNSLGLYVCSTDAFITIEHASYFDRGWCLLECLYADTSKVPRYLMTAGGELRPMVAEDRVGLKRPHQGNFTVETDRAFMRNLEAVAQLVSSQLERGGLMDLTGHSPGKTPNKAIKVNETMNARIDALTSGSE